MRSNFRELRLFRRSIAIVSVLSILGLGLLEPAIRSDIQYKLFAWFAALVTFYLAVGEYIELGRRRAWWSDLSRCAILANGMTLVVLPPGEGDKAVLFAVVILALSYLARILTGRNLAWLAACVLFGAGVLSVELYLRQNFPVETGSWGELPALQQHHSRVYSLIPDSTTHLRYNKYNYVLKTNSVGLPGPNIPPKRAGEFRILLAGDAFTMPEGLPYEQSYASLLQTSLDDTSQTIRIINAGVTGYGPNESLAQIDELVASLDVDFVVYQFFVNEFEEINIEPATRLQDIGLAEQPQNLRTRYIGRSQTLARLDQAKEQLLEVATGRSPDWKYDVSFVDLYTAARGDVYTNDLIDRVESTLRKIADAAGNELVILYTPSAIEVAEPTSFSYFPSDRDGSLRDSLDMNLPFRKLSEIADRLGLEVLDPRATLRDTAIAYHRDSWHWTPAGHAAIAKYLSEQLSDIVNEQ